MTTEEGRGLGQILKALYGAGPQMSQVLREKIPTPDGAALDCQILVPENPRGLMVYFHGGGWVIGAIDEYETLGRNLAQQTGCAVALVEYRLAPEHPYPTPTNDAYAATQWAAEQGERLLGAKLPLIVAGDSAGGNLAAVVAQRAARPGGPEIALQVLVYPVTDCDTENASYTNPFNQLLLSRDGMLWFWERYVPNAEDRKNIDVSPLRAEDVSGVAPAVVVTAEFDPLRDEGEAYADKLRAAGVPVTFKRFERQMHAFFQLVNVLPGAQEGIKWVADQVDAHLSPRVELDALVVGAGFSGLYQLYRLREAGFSVRVIDAAPAIGGTWYANRYPGCRCDIESLHYSYSFSKELEQEWEWTEKYPSQPEILRYMNHVADRFSLWPDIKLSCKMEKAEWDEDAERWMVRTGTGETYAARHLVMATGCLSTPKAIDIPGVDRFQGPTYHTANWPHEGVDFTGKRVGVIGTGSSGIQAIPEIAKQAKELTVFQRTANFSFPTFNRPLTAEEQREVKANYPALRQEARMAGFGIVAPPSPLSAFQVSAEERNAEYEKRWKEGKIVAVLTAYNDLVLSKEANDTAAEFVRQKIREKVKDPQVAEDLIPTDHPVGAKRPCMDTNYFETYNEPHVRLVNLKKTPIESVTSTGVKTSAESFEFDALVFATGFDALTGTLVRLDIRGRNGVQLKDKWADGPVSHLGLTVNKFPNFFVITGPSSPSVLSNMMVSIEQHVDWVSDCIIHLREKGLTTIEPTQEAEEEWRAHVEATGNRTVYPLANSWYMGSNVPGKPRVFLAYIGGVGTYRQICGAIAATGYDGFELSASEPATVG